MFHKHQLDRIEGKLDRLLAERDDAPFMSDVPSFEGNALVDLSGRPSVSMGRNKGGGLGGRLGRLSAWLDMHGSAPQDRERALLERIAHLESRFDEFESLRNDPSESSSEERRGGAHPRIRSEKKSENGHDRKRLEAPPSSLPPAPTSPAVSELSPTPSKGKKKAVHSVSGLICDECATRRGGVWPEDYSATTHDGPCEVCGKVASLSSTTDWDWPSGQPDELVPASPSPAPSPTPPKGKKPTRRLNGLGVKLAGEIHR